MEKSELKSYGSKDMRHYTHLKVSYLGNKCESGKSKDDTVSSFIINSATRNRMVWKESSECE
jgi:hypothetical protein